MPIWQLAVNGFIGGLSTECKHKIFYGRSPPIGAIG